MAERPAETQALDRRFDQAQASAKARDIADVALAFCQAVKLNSKAVFNRHLAVLNAWLNGANPLIVSFEHQKDVGRLPNGTIYDEQRGTAEQAINPYCWRELVYGALTLDSLGTSYYGPYAVVLRDVTIDERATVFEENPFIFNPKHHVIAGASPPVGYRAAWSNRDRLAFAKLAPKLRTGMAESDFVDVLMEPRRDESDCDFVEVHIYGGVNRAGIELVTGPKPLRRADVALWRQSVKALKALGANVEETG